MLAEAKEILQKSFGYSDFRPLQEDIISNVIDGKDTLVLMPTGGGKSLCFQIPALLQDGVTIVVSPLISLMKDQVEALRSNGIIAAYYNSSLTAVQENQVVNDVLNGKIKLLYLSPEKLISSTEGWIKNAPISLVAIDEAHCVSMWGHDFRPEYAQLKEFRSQLNDIPFIALTATADKTTRKDIIKQIGLKEPEVFISSFDRKNLSLEVRPNVPKKKKMQEIVRFIESKPNQSGIIYCLSRKGAEEMANDLIKAGVIARTYHAGLSSTIRSDVQEAFINDNIQVICATIAFGMGIDKSNVRWIIHNNLPKNIEGYYQEIGRAGRDGMEAETILYYNLRDLMVLKQFATNGAQSDMYLEKLYRMLNYAEATICRRKILLSYFSEPLEENCGNCDVCLNPPTFFNGSVLAQKALSAVYRTQEKVGTNMLINILRGSANQDIFANGYQNIKTYGAGRDISFKDWQHYVSQFLNLGVLEIAYDESFTLKITDFGKEVLYGNKSIELTHPIVQEKVNEKKKKEKKKLTPDEELFEKLREVRKEIAIQEKVPAYIVFHDATLKEMASEKPTSEMDLLAVQGISEVKLQKYGSPFLQAIKAFKDSKLSTAEQTYQLYQTGMSVDQICLTRELKLPTIISHLCGMYLAGKKVDLNPLITQNELAAVIKAHDSIKDASTLKPYYEFLDEKIPYHTIRVGLTIIEKG